MIKNLKFREYQTGTTIHYFSTGLYPGIEFVNNVFPREIDHLDIKPACIIVNQAGQLIDNSIFNSKKIMYHDVSTAVNGLWYLNEGENIYSQLSAYTVPNNYQILTGYGVYNKTRYLPNSEILTGLTLSFYQEPTLSASTNKVFYEKTLLDDLFVDIKLERSYNIMETLKIKNSLINSWTEQEGTTGIVFGKLEAIQKIEDDDGNRVRIPLRNVPIGVFNTSEEFLQVTSSDDNGNRIRMNFKDAFYPDTYFNNESRLLDIVFLPSATGYINTKTI